MDAALDPNRVAIASDSTPVKTAARPKRAPTGMSWWLAVLASLTMVGCASQSPSASPFPGSPGTPAQPQDMGHPPPFQPTYCCVAHAAPESTPKATQDAAPVQSR